MAFKLDKSETTVRDQFIEGLREAAGKVEDAINVYNEAVLALRTTLEAAVAEYNEVVLAAQGFAEDIGRRADEEFDDKSERWQEGDKGQSAGEWRDAWQGAEFEELSIEFPEDISSEIPDVADALEELPVEAE